MTRNLTLVAALFATTSMLALTAQAAENTQMTTTGVRVIENGTLHTTSDFNGVTDEEILRSHSDGVRVKWNGSNVMGDNAPHPLFIDQQRYETVATQVAVPQAPVDAGGNPYATTVLFDFDEHYLTTEGKARMDTLISRLHSEGLTRVNVQGHTDTTGSNDYNLALSHQRASSVVDYMNQKGISAQIGTVTWEGETDLAVPTANGVRLQENRRVQVQAL